MDRGYVACGQASADFFFVNAAIALGYNELAGFA
jgi:hypothetical protein